MFRTSASKVYTKFEPTLNQASTKFKIGGLGVVHRLLDVPLTGKSASFRSCVRAGEAKLRVCVREIMLPYAGLPILELFSSASPSLID